MGEYVPIKGTRTWIEASGEGAPVLFLHGGFSNCDAILGVFAPLASEYRLVGFDRRGHGRTADTEAPFSYDEMADQTIGVLAHLGGAPTPLVGYSDGGIVALEVALKRPDLVRSLVLIGVNYHFNGLVPGVFDEFQPESESVEFLRPAYVERSPDGDEHFPAIIAKGCELFSRAPTLAPDDLTGITMPALVLVGDDDAVTAAHTMSLYEHLPNSQLAVVPGASHIVPHEKPELVVQLVGEFLRTNGEVTTFMPIRRA
jgi:pimeloyl-ACP methyl ester carboxylesterase